MTEQTNGSPADCPLCHGAGVMFNVPCQFYCDYYRMTAQTAAQRKAAERARKKEAGLARVEVWVHPNDAKRIKEHAADLNAFRLKAKAPKQR